ncbi:MAG TPA: hypothetical protein DCP25_03465 [Chloroflexi bacterium]|jgi:hypothetical protein|nr:hypothetical protein [Chloroflexota bacterium]
MFSRLLEKKTCEILEAVDALRPGLDVLERLRMDGALPERPAHEGLGIGARDGEHGTVPERRPRDPDERVTNERPCGSPHH